MGVAEMIPAPQEREAGPEQIRLVGRRRKPSVGWAVSHSENPVNYIGSHNRPENQ